MSDATESKLLTWVKWLAGGMGLMLSSAFGVGLWVANQQSEIRSLLKADQEQISDTGEIRAAIKSQDALLQQLRQESLLQSRDISYVRTSVEKIERSVEAGRSGNAALR